MHLQTKIPDELEGKRLDVALAALFSAYSRSFLQSWIKAGCVKLDGKVVDKQRTKVVAGQEIVLEIIAAENVQKQGAQSHTPQNIKLAIVYEDEDLIIVNKPVGMVVHPGAGNKENTLLNALLHHDPKLADLPRAGLIHRLDKDTSGLLIVARTLEAYTKLTRALQKRQIKREYEAIVCGVMTAGGSVDAQIGRHHAQRTRMAVKEGGEGSGARRAITHYRVLEKFRAHTHVRIMLETGRTHQIRVHMAHIHYPIVGDQTYGRRLCLPKGGSAKLCDYLRNFKRQALHAVRLELQHPQSDEIMHWQAPLPEDMRKLLVLLREN